jgi:hypothetical protein
MTIAGMGHDLPRVVWPRLIEAIATHAHDADAAINADAERLPRPAGSPLQPDPQG